MQRNAVALGTFDGLHIGHMAVLAATEGFRRVAITFDRPPKLTALGQSGLIMLPSDRFAALGRIGIDEILSLDFEEVRDMLPIEFLDMLWERYHPARIACGFNYRFGRGATGDTDTIKEYCLKKNIEFICCKKVQKDGEVISSSKIRRLISAGNIEEANHLLYRDFGFCARVEKGDKRGRTIGFPTINQNYPEQLVKPRYGVYRSQVLLDGRAFTGITNIGIRPTYQTEYPICETHILGFSGDIYGREVTLLPHQFLRDEKKFASLDELKAAIAADKEAIEW